MLGLLCACWTVPASGQAQLSGAIRGTVLDEDFSIGLPGAEVLLEGGAQPIRTDEEGRFFFDKVAPGVYTLLASKSGYLRGRVGDIVVNPGSVSEARVRLTAEVVELDEFVVSGEDLIDATDTLDPIMITQDLQSFASALGRDFLSKAGGSDVGGAVKRLAGTSVVDSKYVVIRGLSDRYNVVVLNSARLPSSDPDKRAVNIDLFPSNLIETIVSSKTFTPDLPGEATGGYLNLVTRAIPDKPFVSFSMDVGYNTQSTGNPDFISYRGGGIGFLGEAKSRELPGFLKNTNALTLPFSPATQILDFGLGTTFTPSEEIINRRQAAAEALRNRPLGVNVQEAPNDFSMSLSAGTVIEDFFEGRLGVIGALTYDKSYTLNLGKRGSSGLIPPDEFIKNAEFDYQEGVESLLAGALLSVGWEGRQGDEVVFTFFTNLAIDDSAQFALGEYQSLTDPNDDIPPLEAGNPGVRETINYTDRRLSTLQVRGEHVFEDSGDIKIDWIGAYSWTSQNQPDLRISNYAYSVASDRFTALPNDIFPGFQNDRIWRRLDDQNFNLNLNIEIPFTDPGEESGKFKVGGSFDHSDREYVSENFAYLIDYNPNVVPITGTGGRLGPSDERDGLTIADQLTTQDLTSTQVFPLPPPFRFESDGTFLVRPTFPQATERYFGDQNIAAIYGMTEINVSPDVEIIFGGRVETTDIRIQNIVDLETLTGDATAIFEALGLTEDQILNPRVEATDLLPALAAKWSLTDEVNLRGSIARTIARPTFKELAPVFAKDPISGDFFLGNPALQRSDIWNYDVRGEWFPTPGDLVIVSFFSKMIDNPIENTNLGNFDTVTNEVAASIYGFELEASKRLEEWGPFFEDITLGFNFAKILSTVDLAGNSRNLRESAGLPGTRPLQGQPDYTMNFNFQYDNEDFGFSFGTFLNITGDLLYQVGGVSGNDIFPDVFQESFTSLDVAMSKTLYDEWKLGIKVGNLLNSGINRVFRVGNSTVGPYDTREFGTTYSVGLSRDW